MNNRKPPETRYSMRKRLKVDDEKKEEKQIPVKENNVQKLHKIFNFFTENKKNLAAEIKLDDCFRLMKLETEITELFESLLFQGNCDKNGTIQDRLLHEAIEGDNLPLLKQLIKRGDIKKSICSHEIPPLFELIAKEKFEWIEIFYKAGVSFKEQRTKSGMPLLHFTLKQKEVDKELMQKLLFYGAELSAKDSNDLTPLHYLLTEQVKMTNWQKKDFVKLFLKFGVNPNSRSLLEGETPLHTAVRNKNAIAVQLLLFYGADINLKNINNDTAFELMTKYPCHNALWRKNIDEDYICSTLMKHFFWLKLNCKHIDKTILSRRKIIYSKRHMKIDAIDIKTSEQFNVMFILIFGENKMANSYLTGDFHISTIMKREPYRYWKRFLKFRIKKSRQRYILLKKCETLFMQLFQLPSIFVKKMLKTLSTTDLRSLYAAFYPNSFMEKLIVESIKLTEDSDGESSVDQFQDNEDNNSDNSSSDESDD
ncbi:uncharacterized protein LOC127283765 [Leptopilina boulardi]|uniref:uncharacterized protein LOC127283765 n=1 Tax=Leptopilina boulardi TaxID=63433 RepID=UPI0021F54059|nr:uncharacterized protein LOC127283765 [Leptopilina boulardi]